MAPSRSTTAARYSGSENGSPSAAAPAGIPVDCGGVVMGPEPNAGRVSWRRSRMPGRNTASPKNRSAPPQRSGPPTRTKRPACGPGPIRRHRVSTESINGTTDGTEDFPTVTNDDADARAAVEADRAARSFADFGVRADIVDALARVHITSPFPIQAMTLPVALDGHDIIGQAKTGTGKTLGFGLPLLQRTVALGEPGFDELHAPGKPQALVVVPTRELAVQVAGDLETASALRPTRVLTVYGGRAYEPQVEALRKGVEVVVGTPGRLIDLAQQGLLDLGHVRSLVLDEADEMLDLGFLPDVEKIVRLIPAGRQTMLFSATMPGAIITLARSYMHHPTHIRAVDPDDDGQTVKAVEQHVFRAHAMDKVEMLARILQSDGRGLTLVFCRTKRTAAKVADELADRGFASGAVHGDRS